MSKHHIKATAIKMIKEDGLINLTRQGLCDRAGVADGSFISIMECTFTVFVARLRSLNLPEPSRPSIKYRTIPLLRKEQILNAAVEVAIENNYSTMKREMIADRAGVSPGLINNYFSTMQQLRRKVMRIAVKNSIVEIIAQGLVNGDKQARKASAKIKEEAAKIIANS